MELFRTGSRMLAEFHAVPQLFEHAVIVGGTGMLADATRFIRARSKRLTLVTRKAKPMGLTTLPDETCRVDWRNEAAFSAALLPRISAVPPDLALLWIHLSGQRALLWLMRQLVMRPVLIVHVMGSSSGDPLLDNDDIKSIIAKAPWVRYVTVVLGSKGLPDGRRRWLTDLEISAGTIEAIQNGRDVVVGEIVPED
jgi:hypothetical protein